jgi:hypothetical protein
MSNRAAQAWAVGLLFCAVLIASASGALASGPKTKTKVFPVTNLQCLGTPGDTKLHCPDPSRVASINSASPLTVFYTPPAGHCADVKLDFYVDGNPDGSTPFTTKNGAGGVQRATYLGTLDESVSTGPNSYQLTIIGGKEAIPR